MEEIADGHIRDAGFSFKKIIGIVLLTLLGGVFLFSALVKLNAFSFPFFRHVAPLSACAGVDNLLPFEWTFLDLLPVSMLWASVLSRIFIGLELLIGLFLIAHVYLRTFTYKATIALLILLSGYIVILLVREGNNGNCGCFGQCFYFSPVSSLLKNAAMVAAIVILWFIYPKKDSVKQSVLTPVLLVMIAFAVPFASNPIYLSDSGEATHQPIDLAPVYAKGIPAPFVNLRSGKHIVAFLSATCPHCKKTAYLMQILHRQHPEFPLYYVLNGTPGNEVKFFQDTKSDAVPHSLLNDMQAFITLAGAAVPAIYWINNGIIERKTYYTELEPATIRDWLK